MINSKSRPDVPRPSRRSELLRSQSVTLVGKYVRFTSRMWGSRSALASRGRPRGHGHRRRSSRVSEDRKLPDSQRRFSKEVYITDVVIQTAMQDGHSVPPGGRQISAIRDRFPPQWKSQAAALKPGTIKVRGNSMLDRNMVRIGACGRSVIESRMPAALPQQMFQTHFFPSTVSICSNIHFGSSYMMKCLQLSRTATFASPSPPTPSRFSNSSFD